MSEHKEVTFLDNGIFANWKFSDDEWRDITSLYETGALPKIKFIEFGVVDKRTKQPAPKTRLEILQEFYDSFINSPRTANLRSLSECARKLAEIDREEAIEKEPRGKCLTCKFWKQDSKDIKLGRCRPPFGMGDLTRNDYRCDGYVVAADRVAVRLAENER